MEASLTETRRPRLSPRALPLLTHFFPLFVPTAFRWLVALALFLTALTVGKTAAAQGLVRVAVAPAAGPRASAPAKMTEGLASGLNGSGLLAVAGRRYRTKAKAVGIPMTDPAAAKAVGAKYLVTVRIKRSRRQYSATAQLVNLDGTLLESIERRYKRGAGARQAGLSIGQQLAAVIKGERAATGLPRARTAPAAPSSKRTSAPIPRAAPPRAPKPDKAPVATSLRTDAAPSKTVARETKVTRSAPRRSKSARGGEDRDLRIRLGIGSQLTSSYGVSAGGAETGLDYSLAPLPRIEADVQYFLPSLGLGARLEFGMAFVSYAIDVDPPVQPNEPSGSFLSIGGHVFYPIEVATFGESRLSVVPLVGAGYSAFTVDSQGPNSVIVSYSGIDIVGGVRGQLALSESLAIDADLRFGALLGFSEDPTTTGADGIGFSVSAGASARYWIWSSLGVSADLSYRFQQVGLSGTGTRVAFEGDPALQDASVSSGDLRATAGAVVAF